jgi:hypothetical protein
VIGQGRAAQGRPAASIKFLKPFLERKFLPGIVADRSHAFHKEAIMGRGILLWLLGVPIPIIILILLFWH